MPIEIKELHIKATVVDRKSVGTAGKGVSRIDQEKMKKDIIKDCVREVMRVLDDKKER